MQRERKVKQDKESGMGVWGGRRTKVKEKSRTSLGMVHASFTWGNVMG